MSDRTPIRGARQGNADLSFSIEPFDGDSLFRDLSRSNGYSLILFERGRGTLHIGDSPRVLSGGGALLTLSPYQGFKIDEGTNQHGFMIRFHPDFLCVYKHHRELSCDGVLFDDAYGLPLLPLGEEELEALGSIARKMLEELRGDLAAADEMLLSYLKIFILQAVRLRLVTAGRSDPQTGRPAAPLPRRFRDAVEENFRKLHAVEDYVRLLSVPAKSLARECRAELGKGPRTIIIDRIIVEAKRELYLTDAPVKEVAYRLGYADEFHFSRLFKSEVGVSPSAYRDSVGMGRGLLRRVI